MNTPTCSDCGASIEVITEFNRVDGQLLCWTCLVPNPNEKWRVTVRWASALPTVKEVAQLRSLVSEFQKKTSKELWQQLRNESEVVVGTFYKPQLDQMIARNEKYGLSLEVRNTLDDKTDDPILDRLLLAIQRNDAALVSDFAAQVENINTLTDDGTDMLSFSIDAGCLEAARVLIDSGIELANSESKYTAMQTALETGATSIIDALLKQRVELNCKGTQEDSYAIHLLCRNYRSKELLSRFLQLGADPELLDGNRETPLTILNDSIEDDENGTELRAMIELLEKATGST